MFVVFLRFVDLFCDFLFLVDFRICFFSIYVFSILGSSFYDLWILLFDCFFSDLWLCVLMMSNIVLMICVVLCGVMFVGV